ncbi:MAG: hypothetical protein LBM25_04290 [Bacteroidales bacterium]|jgi:hypothetical protein|nr:hypothetical protein [Bacteroidales bacterium]
MAKNKERSLLLGNLLQCMDFIGWVPCINKELSLKLFDTTNSSSFDYINNNQSTLLGDIDKYSVSIKTAQGDYIEEIIQKHYIVASSFYTCRDSKIGKDFNRSFRFIFIGAINDKTYKESFADCLWIDEEELEYEENLLLGKLIILPYLGKVRKEENEFLIAIKELTKINNNYNKKFNETSSSFEELHQVKNELLEQYKKVEQCVRDIENLEEVEYIEKEGKEKLHRPTILDVALYRDGVLFLKDYIGYIVDDEEDKYVRDHFEEDTLENYADHIPIHRIYKMGYHFIKFLFHKNYYHDEKDDTMLPLSNLNPHQYDYSLNKVVKHQLSAFTNEVFIEKRSNESKRESIGILLYAKAFISVFRDKVMIENDEAKLLNERIDLSIKDIETFSKNKKYVLNSFIQNKSLVPAILLGLSFVMAFFNLLDKLIPDNIRLIIATFICFVVGFFLQRISYLLSKKDVYIPKKQKQNRLFVNTNTDKCKLDYRYLFQINKIDYIDSLLGEWKKDLPKAILFIIVIPLVILISLLILH